jgi:hypothetical protein
MRRVWQVALAAVTLVAVSTPALAQEEAAAAGGGINIIEMFETMGPTAWGVAIVLLIMSFWSVGVAIERIYTYNQARKQSKLYAPQVAKHLKEGRLKEAIALSASKDYRYSHLAKVVLSGLQEYQFQQESGGTLHRDDVLDTVRRSIQRACDHRLDRAVRGAARHRRRCHQRIHGYRHYGFRRYRLGVERYFGSAGRNRSRVVRGDSGSVVLQLPDQPPRVLQRRDGQLLVGAR